MTNKEKLAYELIKSSLRNDLIDIESFFPREVREVCLKALEKADKYRWHDLRKNPDDLPEADEYGCSEYVLVMIGTPEWDNHEWAYYNHNTRTWSTPFYEQNVFAWRYIEPFEESKDDEDRKSVV